MPILSFLGAKPKNKFILGLVERLNKLRWEVNDKYILKPTELSAVIAKEISDYFTKHEAPSSADYLDLVKFFFHLPTTSKFHLNLASLLSRDTATIPQDIFINMEASLVYPFDQIFLHYIADRNGLSCYLKKPHDNPAAYMAVLTSTNEAAKKEADKAEPVIKEIKVQEQRSIFLKLVADYEIKKARLLETMQVTEAAKGDFIPEPIRQTLDSHILMQFQAVQEQQLIISEQENIFLTIKKSLELEQQRICVFSGRSVSPLLEQLKFEIDLTIQSINEIRTQQLLLKNEMSQIINVQMVEVYEQLEVFKSRQLSYNQDLTAFIEVLKIQFNSEKAASDEVLKASVGELLHKLEGLYDNLSHEQKLRDSVYIEYQRQYDAFVHQFEMNNVSHLKFEDFKNLRGLYHSIDEMHEASAKDLAILNANMQRELKEIYDRLIKLAGLPETIKEIAEAVLTLTLDLEVPLVKIERRMSKIEMAIADIDALVRRYELAINGLQRATLEPSDLSEIVRKQLESLVINNNSNRTASAVLSARSSDAVTELHPANRVRFHEVIINKRIGVGSFGSIFEGSWHAQSVAIKCFERVFTEADYVQFRREALIMSRLHHSAITQFVGASLERENLCILMEIMERGNLEENLNKLSLLERLQMGEDLCLGLIYLHSQGCVHGDIKLRNVLINRYYQAKWADFGLTRTNSNSIEELRITETSKNFAWQAPECWNIRAKLSIATDIYSFGMLLWSLMTQQLPYAEKTEIEVMRHVEAGARESLAELPPACAELIARCWAANPADRPINSSELLPTIRHVLGEAYYEQGLKLAVEKSFKAAQQYFEAGSKRGYVRAHSALGISILNWRDDSPAEAELIRVRELFRLGAAGGDWKAMYNLGRMYEKGEGYDQNYSQAFAWYRQAQDHCADEADCQKCKVKADFSLAQLT